MNIAIIPARGGSKRIPGKNMKVFAGKPILAHAIELAKASAIFDRIIVSTDSDEVAKQAEAYGAEVPFRRPPELASDFAPTVGVLVHAVLWLKANGGCDYFCCIYPTAPLIDVICLRKAYWQLRNSSKSILIGVAESPFPLERAFRVVDDHLSICEPGHALSRSQDLPKAYYDAGQFYWGHADRFLDQRTIAADKPGYIVVPELSVQDINTEREWVAAEQKYLNLRSVIEYASFRVKNMPSSSCKLALGAAQLGLHYGIANTHGRPQLVEAEEIVRVSVETGVRIVDTAQSYGESEAILGRTTSSRRCLKSIRFATKLSKSVDVKDERSIMKAVEESLEKLKVSSLWALYLHDESHLDQWDGQLGSCLKRLKNEGIIHNIGASVYEVESAEKALSIDDISVVQIPANVFDRRMERAGIYEKSLDRGVLLFIRSVFLQGLLLMDAALAPKGIPSAREAVEKLESFCKERSLDRKLFAYQYVRSRFPLAITVLGAESSAQALANGLMAQDSTAINVPCSEWEGAWPTDRRELWDPRIWPLYGANRSESRVFGSVS